MMFKHILNHVDRIREGTVQAVPYWGIASKPKESRIKKSISLNTDPKINQSEKL